MIDKGFNKNVFLRQEALLRKRRRTREKRRQRNIVKNSQRSFTSHSSDYQRSNHPEIENIEIHAGTTFSLFQEPESVIKLVDELDKYKINVYYQRRILIDLLEITNIDIGAITFLLAKINEMRSIPRLYIYGNMPKDSICKKKFEDSGFLDYVRSVSGKQFEKHSENFIVSIGKDVTKNERVGKSIRDSVKYLTGELNHYPPVFSIVQEMCSNSVEHANEQKNLKNWFFGICFEYDSNLNCSKVVFTMTDIGYGILKTIKRKFGTKIQEFMTGANDYQILRRAYDKQYQSKTEEINRNRGLPLILDRFDRKYIKDLKVMTNNVYLDFDNTENSKIVNKNLPGTFYYWTLDLNCLETWNQTSIA
jgi:hypothetical protein